MAAVDLPEEVTAALQEHDETNAEKLKALTLALVAKRADAIAYRKSSGIEDVWYKAEEAYLGIDASNRSEFAGAKWAKPMTMTAPVTVGETRPASTIQSNAFVRLTSRYVDAGYAKVSEILLPTNEKAFGFSSTPVPELIKGLKDTSQAVHNGIPLERNARPGELPATPGATVPPQGAVPLAPNAGAAPAAPGPSAPGIPITVKDLAEEALAQANESAKKAEKRIYDWMVESRYRAQGRKVIFDGARIGVGVLKAPFPRKQTTRALADDKKSIRIRSHIVPAYEWKDPWNIYPDPGCGENIQDGDFLFEADPHSAKQVRKFKGSPGYISAAIDLVLTQGPSGPASDYQKPGTTTPNRKQFIVWHYYGTLTRDEMIAAGGMTEAERSGDDVYAICTMINDILVRAQINPLDSGDIPYHNFSWMRRAGYWAGVGVGEQIEMPQAGANASIRAMFNNAGKSSGSTIVLNRGLIEPADQSWQLTPDKIWYMKADASTDDVAKAFQFFQVPNQTKWLMAIFDLCLRIAEEVTNIPLVTQGQSGTTTPETYGATQLQNNNANQLLRSVGHTFDDMITEPVVNQSYEYLILDPDVPDEEKGDWTIDAHGSSALIERAIQDETVAQMGQFAINPMFGVDPKKWFAEFSKTKHLEPKNFQYTPEQQAKIDSTPPVPAPAVQVAQIKVADAEKARAADAQVAQATAEAARATATEVDATKKAIADQKAQVDRERIQKDTDRDTAFVNAEHDRVAVEAQSRREELQLKKDLELLKYANANKMQLVDVKKELAKTAMTLNVQERMQAHDHNHEKQIAAAAAEPTGKAPDGQGFTA